MLRVSKKEQFINLVKAGAASEEANNEMTNLCMSRPNDISFSEWVKKHDWTMGAIVALFRYQCVYLNGGIDWEQFEELFDIFKMKIYPHFV